MAILRAICLRNGASLDAVAERVDPSAEVELIDLSCALDKGDILIVRASDLAALIAPRATYTFAGLRVEVGRGGPTSAAFEDTPLPLTRLELRVLAQLVRARGKPLRREDLLQLCWSESQVKPSSLEAVMSRLRKKLAQVTQVTVFMDRGVGYRLTKPAPRVLVVAEDAAVREALARSFDVGVAPSVERAAEMWREDAPSAVLLALPRGTPLEALPLHGVPVLVLGESEIAARATELGAIVSYRSTIDAKGVATFLEGAPARRERARQVSA